MKICLTLNFTKKRFVRFLYPGYSELEALFPSHAIETYYCSTARTRFSCLAILYVFPLLPLTIRMGQSKTPKGTAL